MSIEKFSGLEQQLRRPRFRKSVYPTVGKLPLRAPGRRRLIDTIPVDNPDAARGLADLLLRLSIDIGQPPAGSYFNRIRQRLLTTPDGQNEAMTAWKAGEIGVSATFNRIDSDERVCSGRLEVSSSDGSVSLQALSSGGDAVEAVWRSMPTGPDRFELADTGRATPQFAARVFHVVNLDVSRGISDGVLVPEISVANGPQ
jgi:hypothetical protein